jgi:hypothetical protein
MATMVHPAKAVSSVEEIFVIEHAPLELRYK